MTNITPSQQQQPHNPRRRKRSSSSCYWIVIVIIQLYVNLQHYHVIMLGCIQQQSILTTTAIPQQVQPRQRLLTLEQEAFCLDFFTMYYSSDTYQLYNENNNNNSINTTTNDNTRRRMLGLMHQYQESLSNHTGHHGNNKSNSDVANVFPPLTTSKTANTATDAAASTGAQVQQQELQQLQLLRHRQGHHLQQQRWLHWNETTTKYPQTNNNNTQRNSMPFRFISTSIPSSTTNAITTSATTPNQTVPATVSITNNHHDHHNGRHRRYRIPTTRIASGNNNNISSSSSSLFCSSFVTGEKQIWNPYKKVLSYAIFGSSSTTRPKATYSTTATSNPNIYPTFPSFSDASNNTLSSSSSSSTNSSTIPEWVLYGMERNILDAQMYYPDWIVRIHVFDLPPFVQEQWLFHQVTKYHNVEWVHCRIGTAMTQSNERKMLSRLLPYDDPKVWFTLARDADSRLSIREVFAVNEFVSAAMALENTAFSTTTTTTSTIKAPTTILQSNISSSTNYYKTTNATAEDMIENNKHNNHPNNDTNEVARMAATKFMSQNNKNPPIYFHVMRDHPQHLMPIMGGMMGMKRGLLSYVSMSKPQSTPTMSMSQLIHQAFTENPIKVRGGFGEDQSFLFRYLWPLVKHVTMDHDVDYPKQCRKFRAKLCRPFPVGPQVEPTNYYVGSPFKIKDQRTDEWFALKQHHECELQCYLVNDTDTETISTSAYTLAPDECMKRRQNEHEWGPLVLCST